MVMKFNFLCFACKGVGCSACTGTGKTVYCGQEELVLARLRAGKLTDHQARDDLGITRLAAVIHKLRRHHDILTHDISVPNRFGQKCCIAEYELIRENAWSSSESTRVSPGHSALST